MFVSVVPSLPTAPHPFQAHTNSISVHATLGNWWKDQRLSHLYELFQMLLSKGCVHCDLSWKMRKRSNKKAITNEVCFHLFMVGGGDLSLSFFLILLLPSHELRHKIFLCPPTQYVQTVFSCNLCPRVQNLLILLHSLVQWVTFKGIYWLKGNVKLPAFYMLSMSILAYSAYILSLIIRIEI